MIGGGEGGDVRLGRGWGLLCGFFQRGGLGGGGFSDGKDLGEYVRGFRRARDEVARRVVGKLLAVVGAVVVEVVRSCCLGVFGAREKGLYRAT